MRQRANAFEDFEPAQDRPARRIQAIAADFLAREFLAFEQERAQTCLRAKRCASRSRRTGADNDDVDNFHCASLSRKHVLLQGAGSRDRRLF
jgi:hypothetical protein